MVTEINAFTLSRIIKFHLLKKKQPLPTRKPNGLAVPIKKNISRERSSISLYPGTATEF